MDGQFTCVNVGQHVVFLYMMNTRCCRRTDNMYRFSVGLTNRGFVTACLSCHATNIRCWLSSAHWANDFNGTPYASVSCMSKPYPVSPIHSIALSVPSSIP